MSLSAIDYLRALTLTVGYKEDQEWGDRDENLCKVYSGRRVGFAVNKLRRIRLWAWQDDQGYYRGWPRTHA